MSLRTPGVQTRNQYGRDWGNYPTPNDLPNAPGGIPPVITLEQLADLELGDVAYTVSDGPYFCSSAGVPGAGDATWERSSGSGGAATDEIWVDGSLGSDVTGDGTPGAPYATIQYPLTLLGHPVSKTDAVRHIRIHIASKHSSTGGIKTSQDNNFDGVYVENLWVPSRMITFEGPGVKIGNTDGATGFGNIQQEVSTGRRFGASSSELRACMTFKGLVETRDSQQRIRNGIHVGGTTRISCIQRNIGTIQGDVIGGTRVTITIAPGQNPYAPAVSPYAALACTFDDATDTVGYTSVIPISNSTGATQQVFFREINLTTGIVVDTYYFVVNATATTFQLSNSVGGAALPLTTNGTGIVMAKPAYVPFEDLIRFKVTGTVGYGTTGSPVAYDIIEQTGPSTFIAKRVTGTNTSAALEAVGRITETDSTGSSTQVTHDIAFDTCLQQGTVVNDTADLMADTNGVGTLVLYAKESRFNAGFINVTTTQRVKDTNLALTANSGATVVSWSRVTNVVTITTDVAFPWATGMILTIAGSVGGPPTIDGTWTLLSGGFGTATFAQTAADDVGGAGGTIAACSQMGSLVTIDNSSFAGAGMVVTGLVYASDDMGLTNLHFNTGFRFHYTGTAAHPQVRLDAGAAHSLLTSGAVESIAVTFQDAGDTVTKTAHGLWNGATITFSAIITTTGITVGTTYFVVNAAVNTFQVALTPGGAAVALTTNGSGICTFAPDQLPGFLDMFVAPSMAELLQFVQTASITATAITETNLLSAGVGMLNFPANWFRVGRSMKIRAEGFYSLLGTAPGPAGSLRIRVKLGATTLLDTGVVANPLPVDFVNERFLIEATIDCRTVGAGGTVMAQGSFEKMGPTSQVLSSQMVNTATIALNTTSAQALTITAQFGAAAAGNTLTLTNLTITG